VLQIQSNQFEHTQNVLQKEEDDKEGEEDYEEKITM